MNLKYQAQIRIPGPDQYAYIEVSVEDTPEATVELYHEYARLMKHGGGIAPQDFNKLLDEYITTGTVKNGVEHWEKMNPYQKSVFQEVKKSIKRNKE